MADPNPFDTLDPAAPTVAPTTKPQGFDASGPWHDLAKDLRGGVGEYLKDTYGREVADSFHQVTQDFHENLQDLRAEKKPSPADLLRSFTHPFEAGGVLRFGKVAADVAGAAQAPFISGPFRAAVARPVADIEAGIPLPGGKYLSRESIEQDTMGALNAMTATKLAPVFRGADALSRAKAGGAEALVNIGGLKGQEAGARAGALLREHGAVGAGKPPRLIDVLPRKGQRLVRQAASKLGDADDLAKEYRKEMRLSVPEEALARTEKLSPSDISVKKQIENEEKQRDEQAKTKYAAPYAVPIQADEGLLDIVNSPQGTSAIARAMKATSERREPSSQTQHVELQNLRTYQHEREAYERDVKRWEAAGGGKFQVEPNQRAQEYLNNPDIPEAVKNRIRQEHGWTPEPKPPEPPFPMLSGGSIDRIRIAMRNRAQHLADMGERDIAGGIGDRSRELDAYLDNVPHLKEARADYRDRSIRIEQLHFDRNLKSMPTKEFEEYVKPLTDEQRQRLVRKWVETKTTEFGVSSRAAQSGEDVMTTGPNTHANLRSLLGKDEADKYMRAIDLIGQKIDKANFIDPGVGSKTAGVQGDAQEIAAHVAMGLATHGAAHATRMLTSVLMGSLFKMNRAESLEVVKWALQEKDVEATIQEIFDAVDPAKTPKLGSSMSPYIRGLLATAAARHPADQAGPIDQKKVDESKTADSVEANVFDKLDPPTPSSDSGAGPERAAPTEPAPTTFTDHMLDDIKGRERSAPDAVSPKGARGPWQITPATADTYGIDISKLTNVAYSRQSATKIMTDLVDQFGEDPDAIRVAWNAGPGAARRWIRAGRDSSVLPRETRKYIGADSTRSDSPSTPAESSDAVAKDLLAEYRPR
jgi:hypothetical protein